MGLSTYIARLDLRLNLGQGVLDLTYLDILRWSS